MAVGVVRPDGVVLPPENVGVVRPDLVGVDVLGGGGGGGYRVEEVDRGVGVFALAVYVGTGWGVVDLWIFGVRGELYELFKFVFGVRGGVERMFDDELLSRFVL